MNVICKPILCTDVICVFESLQGWFIKQLAADCSIPQADCELTVYPQLCFFAQQSSGNYSEVCESQKYGELDQWRPLISFYWLTFEFQIKNSFFATAFVRCLLLLLFLWFSFFWGKQEQVDADQLNTQIAQHLWEFSLAAECSWVSCPRQVVLLINMTFLFLLQHSWIFFSSQASLKYSCCQSTTFSHLWVHTPSRTVGTLQKSNLYAQVTCITWSCILRIHRVAFGRRCTGVLLDARNQNGLKSKRILQKKWHWSKHPLHYPSVCIT